MEYNVEVVFIRLGVLFEVLHELLEKIDTMRAELSRMGLELGIDHPDVLALSRNLDDLIVEYYRGGNKK